MNRVNFALTGSGAIRIVALAAVLTLAVFDTTPSWAAGREIGPEADLCAEVGRTGPGEELVLRPGTYAGPCRIRGGGVPGAPLVIRASNPAQRPLIVYNGTAANVFEIRASHIVIRGLEFGPTQSDVDAIRIYSGNDITVEQCHFSRLAGIAVVANHASVRGLTVRRNVIVDSRATAMYFGCHDGRACSVTGLVIEENFIKKVRAPVDAVGYGIEVKLNSSGIIRGNVVIDTKGPGIMVFGSRDLPAVNMVERNVTIGSDTSSGIVVGGGPAIVRNNVSAGNSEAGIALEDYGKRRLLHGIVIAHNTVYGNRLGGISAAPEGIHDTIIVNNAAHSPIPTKAFPPAQNGIRMAGNVDCSVVACFTSPHQMNFSPFPGSILAGVGAGGLGPWMPRDDLFGSPRGTPPTVGAIEKAAGQLPLEVPAR
jgi:Right handed beta helix region